MPRLITFGCSYTFGEGLPDTYSLSENVSERIASTYAWPAHLGKRLNIETINNAGGGSGNLEILLNIFKFKFYFDDIVIIQWSKFTKIDFYQATSVYGDGKRVNPTGSTAGKHKLLLAKMKIEDEFWLTNIFLRNWLLISQANHFLRMNKIKTFFFLNTTGWEAKDPPVFLDLYGQLNIGPDSWIIDKGFDRSHPGTESHKLLADLIYNEIINELR